MSTSWKRTPRALALMALIVFGIACWQASNRFDSVATASAVRASRAALDGAAAKFQAEPTTENASLLNEARVAFNAAVAADPSYSSANANATIAPSAMVQIQALSAMKQGLTKPQRKIGSRLLIVSRRQQGTLPAGLESLRTSVETNKKGEAVVDITVTNHTAGLKVLDPYNLDITSSAGNIIRAAVAFDKLEEIAALPEVVAIREPGRRFTSRINSASSPQVALANGFALGAGFNQRAARIGEQLRAALANLSAQKTPRAVTVVNISEGDKTHRALDARNSFGFTGTGVKIGVLSDGVDSLAASQATGDLGPVTVLPGQAGSGNEGTAMLEIVHDLAPAAQLFFATSDPTITQFAQNIRDLRTAGCDIIVDDIIYLAESPFQDGQAPSVVSPTNGGVVIQAVKDVTAAGALYFSSAGNEGNKDDATSGTWEGNFNANGTPPALAGGGVAHNFGDGGQSDLVTASSNLVLLDWSDPLGASGNDYDVYDMDGTLTTIFDASTDTQDGNDDPVEISGPAFSGERLVVMLFSGSTRFIRLENFRGRLSLNTTGATFGHSCAAAAFGVAATPAAGAFGPGNPSGPFPNPFTAVNVSELFTADGPRQLFYNADSTAITPGNVLAGGGLVRPKPDITAADGVSTSAPGFSPFFGTSAAALHAAAIAGLIKSFNPALTPAQIRTALVSSAIDIETAGTDRDTGAGIVMAFQALQFLGATPVPNIASAGATIVSENCTPANGAVDPNELVTISFCVQNVGGTDTTNLQGTLQATGGVTNIQPPNPQAYGVVVAGGPPVCRNFTFTAGSVACGAPITASIQFQDGATNLGTVTYTFTTGALGAPVTFSYSGPIVPIPDGADLTGNNPGPPVVANLVVAGFTGSLGDVNLRIDGTSCNTTAGSTTVGIDHTFVNDLRIRLRSPGGIVVEVIRNTDGSGNNFCQTTLDDQSAGPSIQTVVTANAPFTGSFKPANLLDAFNLQTVNGTWQLEAQDYFSFDIGNIRAFSLILSPRVCSTCANCTGLTCPANITTSNDPNQCGAVVTYPAPTTGGTCATPTCSPASGSFFPVGTTTVTCSTTGPPAQTCTFTVTVNDTQPPTITCPANITAVTDQSACVTGACATVNFPPPVATDNCPGVTVVCNPPSGSCLFAGVTTVTCTATDASGNTASCSFTITTFDVALQDDSDPTIILLWNSFDGSYRFCCNGITFTGVGKATRQGCVFTLQTPTAPDRRVLGRVDKAVHSGTASLQAPPGNTRCTITDRNTLNDTNLAACQ